MVEEPSAVSYSSPFLKLPHDPMHDPMTKPRIPRNTVISPWGNAEFLNVWLHCLVVFLQNSRPYQLTLVKYFNPHSPSWTVKPKRLPLPLERVVNKVGHSSSLLPFATPHTPCCCCCCCSKRLVHRHRPDECILAARSNHLCNAKANGLNHVAGLNDIIAENNGIDMRGRFCISFVLRNAQQQQQSASLPHRWLNALQCLSPQS